VVAGRVLSSIRNPAQFVLAAFIGLSLIGTMLLRLPVATDDGVQALGWHESMFWATSAATITGLGPTDVSVFSLYGELVLLVLVQIGGFGIMTIGSVLAIVASRRIGLRQRILARAEIGSVDVGELRTLISAIAKITLVAEATVALILFPSFAADDGTSIGRAAYSAVFHSVSAFNNAGISLQSDSLNGYVDNPFVTVPITIAFIAGGLGFPIIVEFIRRIRPTHWSLHTRITLATTALLLVVGPVVVLAFEWSNPATLGPLDVWEKVQAAWFQGVTPRTAGFHTIDIAGQHDPTLSVQTGLMFIGAGPASTSGGIKVTTFAVLGFAMWSEVRGDQDVNVFRRRIPPAAIRQAMTMALLAVGVVFGMAIALSAMSDFTITHTLFESASAFGTTGLTTGVTRELPDNGQRLLMVVMLAGRVGPVTFVTALALRERTRAYRFAEERPILG
jgi:potassium uptake TrkH family protein